MAISYNVALIRKGGKGYGVYIKSLSNYALIHAIVSGHFPELSINLEETSPEYGKIKMDGNDFTGAVHVNSNRLGKFSTEVKANKFINSLKALSEAEQCKHLAKVRMWMVDKDKVLLRLQYYQLHTNMFGQEFKLLTSQDKAAIERLATDYAGDGVRVRIHKSVARTKAVHPSQVSEVLESSEAKAYNVPGLVGMCKPLSQQGTRYNGGEFSRRITQRRKRTTNVAFWNKYK